MSFLTTEWQWIRQKPIQTWVFCGKFWSICRLWLISFYVQSPSSIMKNLLRPLVCICCKRDFWCYGLAMFLHYPEFFFLNQRQFWKGFLYSSCLKNLVLCSLCCSHSDSLYPFPGILGYCIRWVRLCSIQINYFNINYSWFGLTQLTQLHTFPTIFGLKLITPRNSPYGLCKLQSRDNHTNSFSTWFKAGWKSWSTKQTENGNVFLQQNIKRPNQAETASWSQ